MYQLYKRAKKTVHLILTHASILLYSKISLTMLVVSVVELIGECGV